MNNQKLGAQFPASGNPQDPARSPNFGQDYIAPEPISATPGRVLPSEHHRDSRHTPYTIPVRGPRDAEHNTSGRAHLPVAPPHIPPAPEGPQMVRGQQQDSARPPVPGHDSVVPEPISATPGRVLPSEHHRNSRHTPYTIPVRGPRDAEHNTSGHARDSFASQHELLAPEEHQMALGRSGNRIRPSVSEQDYAVPNRISTAVSELVHGFRYNPYPTRTPVRYSRDVDHNTAAHARGSVASSYILPAAERLQMVRERQQDSAFPSVPGHDSVAPEPISATPGRVLRSKRAPESRYIPYSVPVCDPQVAEHNTANQPSVPGAAIHMWHPGYQQIAAERLQMSTEQNNYSSLLSDAGQLFGSGHVSHARPVRGPLPRSSTTLAGRVSFPLGPHDAGHAQNRIQAPEPERTLQERIARQTKIYGLVCELGREQITLFDFKKRMIRVIQNNFDEPPGLHQYIRVIENDFQPFDYQEKHGGIRHIARTGHILTWATSPNAEEVARMSESTRAKYEGKFWSPYLGYLHDPGQLFEKSLPKIAGKEVWICAVYAPAGNSYFRLARIDEDTREIERFQFTPWMKKINGEVDFDEFDYDFDIPKIMNRRLKNVVTEHAVCIATNIQNPRYSRINRKKGSKRTCHVFFNRLYGIYRCFKPAVLGQWYCHSSTDDRRKEEFKHLSLYRGVTVATMQPVEAPVPTVVLHNQALQMTVQFQMKSLERFDFFWDKFVGKVEVDATMCTWILDWLQFRLVKAQYEGGPDERVCCEELLKKGVTIEARVHTHGPARLLELAEEYPARGAFVLVTVLLMKFKDNDEIIFRA